MPVEQVDFIRNWEVEAFRSKVSTVRETGRLSGKIVLVTGAAQGFGLGIARQLIREGADILLADVNSSLARTEADKLRAENGPGRARALEVDVTDPDSVQTMIRETVLAYGGLDLLVSNAGVLRAGGLEQIDLEAFTLVNNVNYTGFFLCCKYGSQPMKIQNRFQPDWNMDIIQINSKSGLAGSNRNFAYAGSKFGSIGLVQSFALELVVHNIKVNAVCPGNYFDGPLWSDPQKGLFVQYLKAGKVPGARSVTDVRRAYEAKVPMGRGCSPEDVARAILYLVEQCYETGQALPVTGGQIMLN
jgi:NAD(P)-dependent dehydrogenase (short-subunit alcohol dehydrogenase family)